MDFDLSAEQRLIQSTVRDFARQEVAPVAEELDREKRFPYEIVEKLGKLGLMGIPFPEEYGGGGGDTLSYALAIEELARIDASVCITVAAHTSLGTMPIYLWGTEEQKRDWLPQLTAGERLINGAKQFITNSGTDITGCVTITAVTGGSNGRKEVSNIILPNGTPGYE